ncbi:hypothetical protein PoB_006615100 [Plakobranchus ocellatus]|uniref:Uncharacterized protein n=1 Tax=Plakobranchus ocellatus TaxID=259542 RepID=A0AAV4D6S1_9GAST|nr:hypothetical protein PoB_006615100 [Plakobranchus ocellatus]
MCAVVKTFSPADALVFSFPWPLDVGRASTIGSGAGELGAKVRRMRSNDDQSAAPVARLNNLGTVVFNLCPNEGPAS